MGGMNHQRKRESARVGANVPEPAWGEADCENESVGGDFGQQGVLLLLGYNPRRWKKVWGMEADNSKENTSH